MLNKIVIITGPRATYGFCPVPPLNNSAPEGNIFRLVEHINDPEIQVQVISACSKTQYESLRSAKKCYINIPFADKSLQIQKILNAKIISIIANFGLKTPDLFTWIYLKRVSIEVKRINPEIIIINSQPQYIRKIRQMFPSKKVGLFQRGEMGSSRRYLSQLDFIITNSDGITDYIKKIANNADLIIHKIPNSINDNYCSKKKEYTAKPRKIIFTGRINPAKGVLELLKAVSIVKNVMPDVQLLVIGGNFGKGDLTDYEKLLVSTARAGNLDVEFVGHVPNHELAKYYQQADVAVFPSLCLESFGMVALEAMRCGLPVIASCRPGFEELIIDGITGLIVEDPENVELLAKKIICILEDNDLAEKMGRAGYERSLQYAPEKAAEQFIIIINRYLINE